MRETRTAVEPGRAMPAGGLRHGRVLLLLGCGVLLALSLVYDGQVRALLAREWPPLAMVLVRAGTWLGYGVLDVGLFVALAGLARHRGDRAGAVQSLWAAGAVTAAGLLAQVVKNVACRARPTAADPGAFLSAFPCVPAGYAVASFPSGHATTAFAAAVLLSLRYPRGAAVFFGLAVLVGVSRVVLGSHFPSDVVAGAALGSLVALAARGMLPALRDSRGDRE